MSIGSHQGQTQPSDCRHIHSNEVGLRSSQEVNPQVRVNSVAQGGTKCKVSELKTQLLSRWVEAPMGLLAALSTAVRSARLSHDTVSGLILWPWSSQAPRSSAHAVTREGSDSLEGHGGGGGCVN